METDWKGGKVGKEGRESITAEKGGNEWNLYQAGYNLHIHIICIFTCIVIYSLHVSKWFNDNKQGNR